MPVQGQKLGSLRYFVQRAALSSTLEDVSDTNTSRNTVPTSANRAGSALEQVLSIHMVKCFQLYDVRNSLLQVADVFQRNREGAGTVTVARTAENATVAEGLEVLINAALRHEFPNRVAGAADSMGVVFFHTILEDTLHACLRLTFELAPAIWKKEWQSAKIDYRLIEGKNPDEVDRIFFEERFSSFLRNEPLMKKLKKLRNICYSRTTKVQQGRLEQHYGVDEKSLLALDVCRHKIVHQTTFFDPQPSFENHFHSALRAGTYFAQLVKTGFGVHSTSQSLTATLRSVLAASSE